MVKNEITAHAVAAASVVPDVRTVLEIGGQDSKLILLDDGIVTDFAMNSVCAAGTGSFLDQQAFRLDLPVKEIGPLALKSQHPVRIAGRCTVFAESDMIHKQQMGHKLENTVWAVPGTGPQLPQQPGSRQGTEAAGGLPGGRGS